MGNNHIYTLGIFLMISLAVFLIAGSESKQEPNSEGVDVGGEVQNVVLGYKNFNYYPNTIKVQVNKPVRISLDESVGGCYRSFTIRDFGIAKYLTTPNDYVEFTPSKPGSYRFACSMGMGTGTLIIE